MGDRIATMRYWQLKLDKKETLGASTRQCLISEVLFFLSPIPSQKRVARCTNILHTGATLSGVGEGQRLRKGFQSGGVCETQREPKMSGRIRPWVRAEVQEGVCINENRSANWQALSTTESFRQGKIHQQVRLLPIFLSPSSAAKLRHSARNTRLWCKYLCLACTHR
jgi:hypothetical protein